MYRILCILILLLSVGCRETATSEVTAVPPKSDAKANDPSPKPARKEIDAKEAVRIAERFVRDNGYTDFVPKDLTRLQPEGIEFAEREKWLAVRSNTLLPKARGTLKGAMYDPKGWTVGFALVKPLNDPGIGRAVTMDEFGENLKMQHQGFMLKYLESEAK